MSFFKIALALFKGWIYWVSPGEGCSQFFTEMVVPMRCRAPNTYSAAVGEIPGGGRGGAPGGHQGAQASRQAQYG